MQAGVSEVDRMLRYAAATGGEVPHTWTDRDIAGAMGDLAVELVPDAPSRAAALLKSFNDPRMAALYSLHRSATPEEPAAPVVEKAAGSAAWRRIKKAAAAYRAMPEHRHLSEPAALAAVLDQNPDLYARYVAETYRRDLGD